VTVAGEPSVDADTQRSHEARDHSHDR
jgi:hypothetical protein